MTVGTHSGRRHDVPPAGTAAPGRAGPRRRFDLLPYALVTPLTLFIVALALVPAGVTIVQSFFRVDELDPPTRFTGLDNFRQLFADGAVRSSLVNTGLYVVIGVLLSTVLGIVMAVTLQRPFRGRSILIAVLILPWALPGVVEGLVWTGIWDANIGLLNSVLTSTHLISHYQVFLGQHRFLTILAIELVQVWQMTPLSTLLILASLQNIPGELYEAAELDGAGIWRRIRTVTIPQIRLIISLMLLLQIVATMQVYVEPVILAGGAGSEDSATGLVYLIYQHAFNFNDLNGAAAIGVMMLIVLGVFSGLYAWLSRDRD